MKIYLGGRSKKSRHLQLVSRGTLIDLINKRLIELKEDQTVGSIITQVEAENRERYIGVMLAHEKEIEWLENVLLPKLIIEKESEKK